MTSTTHPTVGGAPPMAPSKCFDKEGMGGEEGALIVRKTVERDARSESVESKASVDDTLPYFCLRDLKLFASYLLAWGVLVCVCNVVAGPTASRSPPSADRGLSSGALAKVFGLSSMILLIMVAMELFPMIFTGVTVRRDPSDKRLLFVREATAVLFFVKVVCAASYGILTSGLMPSQLDHLTGRPVMSLRSMEWACSFPLILRLHGLHAFKTTNERIYAAMMLGFFTPMLLHWGSLVPLTWLSWAMHGAAIAGVIGTIYTTSKVSRGGCVSAPSPQQPDGDGGDLVDTICHFILLWSIPVSLTAHTTIFCFAHSGLLSITLEQVGLAAVDVAIKAVETVALACLRNSGSSLILEEAQKGYGNTTTAATPRPQPIIQDTVTAHTHTHTRHVGTFPASAADATTGAKEGGHLRQRQRGQASAAHGQEQRVGSSMSSYHGQGRVPVRSEQQTRVDLLKLQLQKERLEHQLELLELSRRPSASAATAPALSKSRPPHPPTVLRRKKSNTLGDASAAHPGLPPRPRATRSSTSRLHATLPPRQGDKPDGDSQPPAGGVGGVSVGVANTKSFTLADTSSSGTNTSSGEMARSHVGARSSHRQRLIDRKMGHSTKGGGGADDGTLDVRLALGKAAETACEHFVKRRNACLKSLSNKTHRDLVIEYLVCQKRASFLVRRRRLRPRLTPTIAAALRMMYQQQQPPHHDLTGQLGDASGSLVKGCVG